jgi:hypothetical protein
VTVQLPTGSRHDPVAYAAAVGAYGLGTTGRQLPATPLGRVEWRALLAEVRKQRITGFLAWAAADGGIATSPWQRRQAVESHAKARCLVLLLESLLLELVERLESCDIRYCVLKGPALAHLLYREPSIRSYGDIDLLIPAHQLEAATALLGGLGYRRRHPPLRPDFDRRFGKGVTVQPPEGYPVDLHRTLAAGPFAQYINVRELLANSSSFSLRGRPIRTLGHAEHFLHACVHAVLGHAPPRLVSLRDLVQMAQAPEFDLDRVKSLSASWKADAVVARAVCAAWSTFQLADEVPLSVWAHRYRPSRSEGRTLRLYPRGDHFPVMALAQLQAVPGIRAKAAYLRATLVPDRGYLASRGTGHFERWRRAAMTLIKW